MEINHKNLVLGNSKKGNLIQIKCKLSKLIKLMKLILKNLKKQNLIQIRCQFNNLKRLKNKGMKFMLRSNHKILG